MSISTTFLALSALGIGAYLAARLLLRAERGAVRFLAGVVIAWAWVTVGMLVLGCSGFIAPWPIVGWAGLLTALGVIGVIRGTSLDPEPAAVSVEDPKIGWAGVVAMALVVWAVAWRGVPSLMFPVKVVSDGPIYHLYFAAKWWQSGWLDLIATPFGENAAPYFPAVGDLWFGWLMTLWGGDRLAKVGQLPFMVVCGVATYQLARELGIRRDASTVASAFPLLSTPFLAFGMEPNVDTIFVAGYMTSALFLLRWALGRQSFLSLSLGATAAGLAWGTKPTGLVFVSPMLILAAGYAVLRAPRSWRTLGELAALLLFPMIGEGFWLARNLWLTGNPLYPLHLAPGGVVLLQGWYGSDVMQQSPYYLSVLDWRSLWDILLAVFDPRLLPVWIMGVLGFWGIGARQEFRTRWIWLVTGLAVGNLAIYWLAIPYRTQQRFMFQGMFLAAIGVAALIDGRAWRRWLAATLLGLHLVTNQEWPFSRFFHVIPWDLSPFVPNAIEGWVDAVFSWAAGPTLWWQLGLSLVVSALLIRARTWRGHFLGGIAAIALVAASIGVLVLAASRAGGLPGYPPFRDYYRAWLDLDQRTRGGAFRIAYAGTNLPYYLMGRDFRHNVEYVNVNEHRGWLLHDYHRDAIGRGLPTTWDHPRPGWDRLDASYEAWLANLRASHIQLLVVAAANPNEGPHNLADRERFTIERVWADAHPEAFEPIYGVDPPDPLIKIYRVRAGR